MDGSQERRHVVGQENENISQKMTNFPRNAEFQGDLGILCVCMCVRVCACVYVCVRVCVPVYACVYEREKGKNMRLQQSLI